MDDIAVGSVQLGAEAKVGADALSVNIYHLCFIINIMIIFTMIIMKYFLIKVF